MHIWDQINATTGPPTPGVRVCGQRRSIVTLAAISHLFKFLLTGTTFPAMTTTKERIWSASV